MVLTPAAEVIDEFTFSVTTTLEGKTETVPPSLHVVIPAQSRLWVAGEKEIISCPLIVPLMLPIGPPGPVEVPLVPGMIDIVPPGMVHVSVGIVVVTVSVPTAKIPEKLPGPPKGPLAYSC